MSMPKIRILRVMEYLYDSVEKMESDMSHWSVPANGHVNRSSMVIRSSVLPLETFYAKELPVGAVERVDPEDELGKKNI